MKQKDWSSLPKWLVRRMSTILMRLSNSFSYLAWVSGKYIQTLCPCHLLLICRHARKQQLSLAKSYAAIAKGNTQSTKCKVCEESSFPELKPPKFLTYLSLRGLVRFTECCLLLWRLTGGTPEHKTQAKKVWRSQNRLLGFLYSCKSNSIIHTHSQRL